MSERAPYSRIYWSVMDDPKFEHVYGDDAAFALWMRLLMNADALWPAPAALHRTVKDRPLAKLVDTGIVDLLPGDRYRIHGLDAERGRRRDAARTGSERDPNGTRTGTKREANGSPARAFTETNRDELHQDKPTRVNARNEPEPPRPSTVDRSPLMTEMRDAIRDRYGDGMDDLDPLAAGWKVKP